MFFVFLAFIANISPDRIRGVLRDDIFRNLPMSDIGGREGDKINAYGDLPRSP